MASAIDYLRSKRQTKFDNPSQGAEDKKPGDVRAFQLTDDEMKSMEGANEGEEIVLEVAGRLSQGLFNVTSVRSKQDEPSAGPVNPMNPMMPKMV